MAEREVLLLGVTYRGVNDLRPFRFGTFGQVVDVHEEDLERFDRVNGVKKAEEPAPQQREPAPDPAPAEVVQPSRGGSTAQWQDYARSRGATEADIAGKSRDELVAQFGGEEA